MLGTRPMARQTVSAGDVLLRAGDRPAIVVDLDENDRLDLTVAADRLLNGVGGVQFYVLAPQLRHQRLVASHGG